MLADDQNYSFYIQMICQSLIMILKKTIDCNGRDKYKFRTSTEKNSVDVKSRLDYLPGAIFRASRQSGRSVCECVRVYIQLNILQAFSCRTAIVNKFGQQTMRPFSLSST